MKPETDNRNIIKDIKRRFSFVEGHEKQFVLGGLFVAMVLLVVLASIVFINMKEKFQLEMKFSSEKSFNSIYITMIENPSKAYTEMYTEKVSAIGIYSSDGRAYLTLGEAPFILPLEKLIQNRKNGTDSTLGVYYFDRETKEIEYYRLSRLNAEMEAGMYYGKAGTSADIPEIVYVRFDGSHYFTQINRANIVFGLSLISIWGLFVLVISIYMSNRRYREVITRNENLAQLGAAARTLTHEIKNPLSALTIQTALMKKTLPEECQSDLEVIEHEVARLTSLTNRVSEFLKNPVGHPETIEVIPFIKQIIDIFPEGISFKAKENAKLFIEFDADRARSVFENLIKNATESSSSGKPEVEVEVSASKKKSVLISIKDRGDGISAEAKQKLFDPFYTTKIHGSGIGLSISNQFIKARGGKLKVSDREGGGTVVEVVLPRCEVAK